ncbi:hypothetical protein CI109_100320 [Kwoniella shandongensis]|uniref:PH domain-containing protein n=1 Tax=Kwoniella shandongensis TaxID=1734106 RepID=A0AAJ8MUT9_9TREE
MPSIFNKVRRASENVATTNGGHEDPAFRQKRLSVDSPSPTTPPQPNSGGKLKALFGGGNNSKNSSTGDADKRRESLKKKLTSPSSFFRSSVDLSSPTKATRKPSQGNIQTTPSPPDSAALARYTDPAPRRSSTSNQFTSPTLFPDNFTLSQTASPESQPNGSSGRRGSITWEPSYPLEVPDDQYADIPPDGHAAALANGISKPVNATPALANENARRRSSDLTDNLSSWPALRPISTQKISTPPRSQVDLPTPPPSAVAPAKIPSPVSPTTVSSDGSRRRKPSLSLNTSDAILTPPLTERDEPKLPTVSQPETPKTIKAQPSSAIARPNFIPLNDSVPSTPTPSTPTSPPTRPRPHPPSRKTTLIHSPPMPQPIKNLPTMSGWPGYQEASGSTTPIWGALAREGGPRTPGFGGSSTPSGQRTPGASSGFPFALPAVNTPSGKGKERNFLTEEELRKAKRHMPVMLRQPSNLPTNHDDGGDAGDDDDEDSETELEGGGSDDDSEGETETERRASAPTSKGPMGLFSKKGKGKTSSSQVSRMAKSATHEEEANGKSVWSLQTPSEKRVQNSWAQFGPETPRMTPVASPIASAALRSESFASPSRGTLSRNESSYGSTAPTSVNSSGYFDSHPSSSQASLGTSQMADEPKLARGSGGQELVSSGNMVGLGIAHDIHIPSSEPVDEGFVADEADGSDDGSDETNEGSMEAGTSSLGHDGVSEDVQPGDQLPATSVPSTSVTKPKPVSRPSLYSQVSRSMVNLSTSRPQTEEVDEAEATSGATERVSAKPRLETVRSGEKVPSHIDLPPRTPLTGTTAVPATPGWAKPPPTPAAGLNGFNFWGKQEKPKELKRRRSADDLMVAPPQYEPPFPGTVIPRPRDEEGREKLPKYWCAVHIEGLLPRKMEFSSPGVQSRDRSWKKLYFILDGTCLNVYKFDPHRFPLKSDGPIPSIAEDDAEEFLHVHLPGDRRPSVSSVNSSSGTRRPSVVEGRRPSIPGPADGPRRGSVGESFLHAGGRRGSSASNAGSSSTADRRGSESSAVGSGAYRRSSLSTVTNSNGSTTTGSDVKDPALFPSPNKSGTARRGSSSTGVTATTNASSHTATPLSSHFQHNALVKQYTLQHAESGLAADYVKRKNVVRVRAEGEQFLLQTENAQEVVQWIEAFQAATNVALDLDERPMPKIITLPRRRRRRPAGANAQGAQSATVTANGTSTSANNASAVVPGANDTPEGNARVVAAAEAAERERERMLAEDQAAEPVN